MDIPFTLTDRTAKRHLRGGLFMPPDRRRYGKGSSSSTTSGPPAQVLQNYEQNYNQAQNVAQQPYQPYNGSVVAGFQPMQQAGFNAINSAANAGQPFINAASQDVQNSATMLNPQNFGSTVGSYMSPYTQNVVSGYEQQINNQNAIQQNQLAGNAASAGAFGGDRQAVAQSVLAGQQAAQEAPTIANLYNSGFQNATNSAEANAWLNSQAGFSMANLGQQAQSQDLNSANAMLSAGNMQQQMAQQELNVPYESYLAGQAYPYQNTNYMEGMATGLGSMMGGTSTTTQSGGSPISSILGAGLAIAGTAGALGWAPFASGAASGAGTVWAGRGGRIPGLASGGSPNILAAGSNVPDLSVSLVPFDVAGGSHGSTIPQAPPVQNNNPSIGDIASAAKGISNFARYARGRFSGAPDDMTRPGGMSNQMMSATQAALNDSDLEAADMAQNPSLYYSMDYARGGGLPGLGPLFPARHAPAGFGGIAHRADGGSMAPQGMVAAVGGNPAMVNLMQAYSGLPTEKLQELAVRFPPGSPQGGMVNMALRSRQAFPQSTPDQPTVPSGQSAQAENQAAMGAGALPTSQFSRRGGAIHLAGGGDAGMDEGDLGADILTPPPQVPIATPGNTAFYTAPDVSIPPDDYAAALTGLARTISRAHADAPGSDYATMGPNTHLTPNNVSSVGSNSPDLPLEQPGNVAGLDRLEAAKNHLSQRAATAGFSALPPAAPTTGAAEPGTPGMEVNLHSPNGTPPLLPGLTPPPMATADAAPPAPVKPFSAPSPRPVPQPVPQPGPRPVGQGVAPVPAHIVGLGMASPSSQPQPLQQQEQQFRQALNDQMAARAQQPMPSMQQINTKPSFAESLIAAGLGMMAGRSRDAAVNIGQGGLIGLKDYTSQRQELAQNALRQEQAQWENDYRQAMLRNNGARVDEMQRYHEQQAAQAQDRLAWAEALHAAGRGGAGRPPTGQNAEMTSLYNFFADPKNTGGTKLNEAQIWDQVNQHLPAGQRLKETANYHTTTASQRGAAQGATASRSYDAILAATIRTMIANNPGLSPDAAAVQSQSSLKKIGIVPPQSALPSGAPDSDPLSLFKGP